MQEIKITKNRNETEVGKVAWRIKTDGWKFMWKDVFQIPFTTIPQFIYKTVPKTEKITKKKENK